MPKRLVITINEETGDFSLEMPDGEIAFEELINAVDTTYGLLLDSLGETEKLDQEQTETKFIEKDTKKLN